MKNTKRYIRALGLLVADWSRFFTLSLVDERESSVSNSEDPPHYSRYGEGEKVVVMTNCDDFLATVLL